MEFKMAKKTGPLRQRRTTKPLTLVEAIECLKADLKSSVRDGSFSPMFEITETSVEIAVGFERDLETEGGVNIYVARLGAKGAEKTAATHKVAIKLRILDGEEIEKLKQTGRNVQPRYQGSGNDQNDGANAR
jgi:hypothetical protein